METNNQIDMKSIPIDKRPNIGFNHLDEYINGGLTVESQHSNGALIYIPYGIYTDIFRAMESGMFYIGKEIDNLKTMLKTLYNVENKELAEKLKQDTNHKIKELEKYHKIFEVIEPMINDL